MAERRFGASAMEGKNRAKRKPPWWRAEFRYFVQIAAVAGFAVGQPVLGSFGESPETFVAAGASPVTIVGFGLGVVLLPALLLWALVAPTVYFSPRVRELAQSAAIGFFVALVGLWAFRDLFEERPFVVMSAGVLGVAAAAAYERLDAVKMYLSFASVAPVAFLVMFLAFSPTSLLVFEPDPETAGLSGRSGGPPSVVLVVLDELPTASLLNDRNEIDAGLFPNFAMLGGQSDFYRNNTSIAGQTRAAIPSILTGRYPTREAPVRADYDENLFTLLGDSHQLNIHEAITTLCPSSLCERRTDSGAIGSLGTQAWDLYTKLIESDESTKPPTQKGKPEATEDEGSMVGLNELMEAREDQVGRFIASLERKGERPRLDFVHLLYPHQAWERLPDGRHYFNDEHSLGRIAGIFSTDTAALLTRQRHLLQLQYADKVLGDVVAELKKLDRYDDSYVIVTADHGISFDPQVHDRDIAEGSRHEIMWAPLIIKAPGQTEGELKDTNSEIIDVVPTIADAVGIKIPWKVEGRSLISGKPRPAAEKAYLPRVDRRGYAKMIPIDGVEGYERMLAEPPASAVPSDDPLALYRLPPYTGLTGTAVTDLPHGKPVKWDVQLASPERYENVDPAAETLPVFISGELRTKLSAGDRGDNPERSRLVVSVNGVIGGWGAVELDEPTDGIRIKFGVQVPPSLLRSGPNDIEVWELVGPPDDVSLRPVDGGCCVG